MRRAVGVLMVAALARVSAARNHIGDTDPSGTKHGVEAFVRCGSSTGDFVIHAKKSWAPIGYSRFMELTKDPSFWPDQLIYRNIPHFLAQFGVCADPSTSRKWATEHPVLLDDPHLPRFAPGSFRKGLVSFAGGGPDSRTHHIFISTGDQANFLGGAKHETPFGTIDGGADGEGFAHILAWYHGDETAQAEHEQHAYVTRGNEYMAPKYPSLSRITGCTIERTIYPGDSDGGQHHNGWEHDL